MASTVPNTKVCTRHLRGFGRYDTGTTRDPYPSGMLQFEASRILCLAYLKIDISGLQNHFSVSTDWTC